MYTYNIHTYIYTDIYIHIYIHEIDNTYPNSLQNILHVSKLFLISLYSIFIINKLIKVVMNNEYMTIEYL